MAAFYSRVVAQLLAEGRLQTTMRILVVCGGPLDRDTLAGAGFRNGVVSNIDAGTTGSDFAPFESSRQDVENLTYADGEFDVVIVHAGLHHCRSPHRGLLEMYRVARRGVLVFEARDSLTMWFACRLGIALDYELPAVTEYDCRRGGVANTCIPNYVYRWTEREVRKTIASYCPEARLDFRFFHGLDINFDWIGTYSRFWPLAIRCGMPLVRLLTAVFPGQANGFAFWAGKPELPRDLQPWLVMQEGQIAPDPQRMGKKAPPPSCT